MDEVELRLTVGRMDRLLTLILKIVMLMAFAVLATIGFFAHHLFNYRLRKAARLCPCPSCGQALGVGALHAADEYWKGRSSDHRDDPVSMVIHRKIYALCPACGAHLDFRESSGIFEPVESDDSTFAATDADRI